MTHAPDRTRLTSETTSPDPPPPPSPPLPRTRLTSPNYPLTSPNSPRLRTREPRFRLTESEYRLLVQQAKRWGERNVPTSGIRHRPPVIGAYIGWLLEERDRLSRGPRAVSGRLGERKVRYARAVAPWSPKEHRYEGPPKVPRAELCLRRAILTEFPKNGDSETRRRALEAARLGIVAAVEERELLDALSLSARDVGLVHWLKPADAQRLCG